MNLTANLRTTSHFVLSVAALISLPTEARADNPFVQTSYTADPAPFVHDGKIYVYTSHDEDVTVNDFYTMNDWMLFSTEDMVNWTDHGIVAGLDDFNWSTDSAWAPQGIERNGSYFLYVPLNNNTGARIGVGVSDNIAGPFTDPLGTHLVQTANHDIDPTIFIDDDGQAYMYWGNATLQYVTLNEDMISLSGNPTTVPLQGFTEGPWLHKHDGLYYVIYAAQGTGSEKISYATSDSPTGPWTVRGDIMASGPTYTNHPGVVDYRGHSYFFYHNSALPGGNNYKRSVCVQEFSYGTDGSIPLLSMDNQGPEALQTLNPFEQVEAETIAFASGLKTEPCDDTGGGMNVTQINDGDFIKVENVDFIDGVTSFDARVAGASGGASIELHLDSESGTSLGSCDVSGATSWTTVTCDVSGGSGTHDLFLVFSGTGNDLFKFNWWAFDGPTVPVYGTGGAAGSGGGGGTTDSGGSGSATGGSSAGTGVGGSVSASGGSGGGAAMATGGDGAVAPGAGGGPDITGGNPNPETGCSCDLGSNRPRGFGSIAPLLAAGALLLARRRRHTS